MKKIIIFCDNAKIHKSNQFMLNTFNKFYTLLYNAAYTPQYNPIELCFSKIKSIFRR